MKCTDRTSSNAGLQDATTRVDATCREVVAGRLASRDLAVWVKPVGLTEAEFRLLWLLARQENGQTSERPGDQAALARELAVSAAQVSGLVERLRSQGVIECAASGGDRRRQSWRLTAAGHQLVARVLSVVAAIGMSPLAPPFEGGEFDVEAAA